MGITRTDFMWVFWGLTLVKLCSGCHCDADTANGKALQDEVTEPRGRHRLQLLFPLLLRISTRLATLVPTALMGLFGIILFVVFSKKALIVSLFALLLSLSGKYSGKNSEEIYIHKIDSYPDYNDEEHIHYHHGPVKPKKNSYHPGKKLKKYYKRTIPSASSTSDPWHGFYEANGKPFKPLASFQKRATLAEKATELSSQVKKDRKRERETGEVRSRLT